MAYLSPKTIIVDFLRKNVTDPRSRISTTSDSFTATALQKEFQLTPTAGKTLSHIISVTVASATQSKWEDFYIDFKSQKVIFFTGVTLSAAVVISYGESEKNWIFPRMPNTKLNALSYPRMNVNVVSSPGSRLGNYEAPVEGVTRYQIDIWAKEKQNAQIFTIDSLKYTGEDLVEYLSYKITKAFEDNEDELFPALYGYDPVSMSPDLPFVDELQCHHKVVEFIARGLDIGRID